METIDNDTQTDEEGADSSMVVVKPGNHSYYLDGYLKANLDNISKDVRRRDFDCFLVIAGREGYAKSTLAAQIATYLDPTYSVKRCCFTADQFERCVTKSEKFQAIVFDETMGYLSSRGALSKFNRSLVKVMSEMRSKNLFVILCITSFFELDKYPAIHRSTGLIVIKERTKFGCYNYITKKNLYLFGKKFYSYKIPPDFIGRFIKYFPYNKEEYEAKKQRAIAEWTKAKVKEKVLQERIIALEDHLHKIYLYPPQKIAEITGEDFKTIADNLDVDVSIGNEG